MYVANKIGFFVLILHRWKSRLILNISRLIYSLYFWRRQNDLKWKETVGGVVLFFNFKQVYIHLSPLSIVVYKHFSVFVLLGAQTKAFVYLIDGDNVEIDNRVNQGYQYFVFLFSVPVVP